MHFHSKHICQTVNWNILFHITINKMSSLIEGYNFSKTQYLYHNTCAFIMIGICNATCTNNQIPQIITIFSGFWGKFLLC